MLGITGVDLVPGALGSGVKAELPPVRGHSAAPEPGCALSGPRSQVLTVSVRSTEQLSF